MKNSTLKRVLLPAFTLGLIGGGIFILIGMVIYLGQTRANQMGYNELVFGYQNFAVMVSGIFGFTGWFLATLIYMIAKTRNLGWRRLTCFAGFAAGFLGNFIIASSNSSYGLIQRSVAVMLIDSVLFGLAGVALAFLVATLILATNAFILKN